MGTQFFDGSGIGGSDMPVADLLQMIGRASRPLVDDMGKCVLMCHGPKASHMVGLLFILINYNCTAIVYTVCVVYECSGEASGGQHGQVRGQVGVVVGLLG